MLDESLRDARCQSPERGDRTLLRFLILFALFALFFNLGGRPIETKDYLKYPEIAREILEFGDWTMLYDGGKIYVDKPPLQFWLIAVSYKLFGVNPFAARLPSAIAAFCGVLLAFGFARKFFGNSRIGFLAAMILLSTYDYCWYARRTRLDIVFAVLFSASIISFYLGCEAASRRGKLLWYATFWLATAFAFLDKAFIALANSVVLIPYGLTVAFKPAGRKVAPGLLAATSLLFFIAVSLWILALVSHPEFSTYWEILGRTKIMDRQEAFYFYLIQMPLKIFPATPFFVAGIWVFLRDRRRISEGRVLGFSLLWIAAFLLILHLTVAKNPRYLLPIYLPCSLVSAWAMDFFLRNKPDSFGPVLTWADRILLGAAALSLAAPFVMAYHHKVSLLTPLMPVGILAAAFFLARKLLPPEAKPASLFISFVVLLLTIDVGDTVVRDTASAYYRMHHILKTEKLAAEEIAVFDCSTRAHEAMGFYYNRLISCTDSWNEIDSNPKIRAVVTSRKAFDDIPPGRIENRGRIIAANPKWVIFIKRK